MDYEWPGNVRELENTIERAVTLTKFEELTVDDLPDKVREYQTTDIVISGDNPDEMPTLEEVERRYVLRVLRAVRGNKTQAAHILGLYRPTLYSKLRKHNIEDPGRAARAAREARVADSDFISREVEGT